MRELRVNAASYADIEPALLLLAKRRISIVHYADIPHSADALKPWNMIDRWFQIQWLAAINIFRSRILRDLGVIEDSKSLAKAAWYQRVFDRNAGLGQELLLAAQGPIDQFVDRFGAIVELSKKLEAAASAEVLELEK